MGTILRSRWLSLVSGAFLIVLGGLIASMDNSFAIYVGLGVGIIGLMLIFNAVHFS